MVGFDAKNKNIVDMTFLCLTCTLIMRDPIQLTECGHRLCQSCVNAQHGITSKCPCYLSKTQRNQVIIDWGFRRDMQSLPVECSLCNWTGTLNNYQVHLNHDHPNPKCQHCDQQFNSVNNLNEHQVLQCQKITVDCLLKDFGCEEQIVHYNISNHYLAEQHQNSLLKAYHQIQLQIENERKTLGQIDYDFPRSRTVLAVDPDTVLLQELCETLNILLDDKEISSNGGSQRLNHTLLQCQKKFPILTLDFLRTKLSVQDRNGYLDGSPSNRNITKQNLTSSEEVNDRLPSVSYNGTFIW